MALTYVGDANADKAKGKSKGKGMSGSKSSVSARRESKSKTPASYHKGHPPPMPAQPRNVPLNRSRNLTMRNRPSGRIEPLGRSSLRSKGSSSSSDKHKGGEKTEEQDLPKGKRRLKAMKNCCRKAVEFMFTQVGVGAVVVFYTLMGASIFQYIETLTEDPSMARVEEYRLDTLRTLWNLTNHFNVLNKQRWKWEISQALFTHEKEMVRFVQEEGYDQLSNVERWTFPSALMFALSVITMIGYGSVVPRTETGKISTIVYACVGIPVYILYFMNMGKVFAIVLKWVYTKAYRWNVRRKWKQSVNYDAIANSGEDTELDEAYLDELEAQVIVPSTTCLWVMIFYLIVGTIMFAEWENWNYLDSIYFCVISLCKIGFGDFVPGAHAVLEKSSETMEDKEAFEEAEKMAQVKLVITFVYLLVGMGVVAMCYYLLKEEVTVRAKQLRETMKLKLLKVKVMLGLSPKEDYVTAFHAFHQ